MYNILLERVNKKLDRADYNMAKDYLDYYAIQPDEIHRYVDEFLSVCYKYNEETGEHEQRMPSELPFADVVYSDDGRYATYTYGGYSETKPTKKFYDYANKLAKSML